jgi:hypothetical protein
MLVSVLLFDNLPRLVKLVCMLSVGCTPRILERSNLRSCVLSFSRTVQIFEVQLKLIVVLRLMASIRAVCPMLTTVRTALFKLASGSHLKRAIPDNPVIMPRMATMTRTSTKLNPRGSRRSRMSRLLFLICFMLMMGIWLSVYSFCTSIHMWSTRPFLTQKRFPPCVCAFSLSTVAGIAFIDP